MVKYLKANKSDKEEIVDFINYVFSHAHAPHDFKLLTPHVYGDDVAGMGAIHYIAKEDEKIKALIAMRVIDIAISDKKLKYGLIGNVSVHPYSRGKGYMKILMKNAMEDARSLGVDIMVLGGQRQRYGYFGFESAGADICYNISADNIRHCFKDVDCSGITFRLLTEADSDDVDKVKALYEENIVHSIRKREEFINIMSAWKKNCRIIYKANEMIGYVYGELNELVLKNENYLPVVLKAIFMADGLNTVGVKCHSFQKERINFLGSICETSFIDQFEMINVLCWENVLRTLFELQAQIKVLSDGDVEVAIEDEVFGISVRNASVSVKKYSAKSEKTICFSRNEAIRVFFGLNSLLTIDKRFFDWLPLAFIIDEPDRF